MKIKKKRLQAILCSTLSDPEKEAKILCELVPLYSGFQELRKKVQDASTEQILAWGTEALQTGKVKDLILSKERNLDDAWDLLLAAAKQAGKGVLNMMMDGHKQDFNRGDYFLEKYNDSGILTDGCRLWAPNLGPWFPGFEETLAKVNLEISESTPFQMWPEEANAQIAAIKKLQDKQQQKITVWEAGGVSATWGYARGQNTVTIGTCTGTSLDLHPDSLRYAIQQGRILSLKAINRFVTAKEKALQIEQSDGTWLCAASVEVQ